MGISGLLPFLKNASRPVHVKEFKGQTAAIDVYCWLHKGAFGCAEQLVQGKPTDAYVKYVMKYVDLLLYFDIKPILVFDGRNLPSKAETEKKRRENRKSNREKAVELLSQGKSREAREYFQRCVDITPQMARDVIVACRERNVDCIVAPYEADAQLAFLSRTVADLVITEDSDLTLFGCDKIIFKLTPSGEGNLYEKSRLNEVFGNLASQFDFEKFRKMCIMSGCDYLPSLPGIGLAKSKQFWSKVTNPNDKVVLPKLPHYLKAPTLTVTQAYIDGFAQANNTFLYQIVFDPQTRKERPLTDYRVDVVPDQLYYCGNFSDTDTALQLALGNLDIHSLRQINRFDPDNHSVQQEARYGSVAKHSSIWSRGYTKETSHKREVRLASVFTSTSTKSRQQVTVRTAFQKPKQTCDRRGDIGTTSKAVQEKRKLDTMTEEDVEQMLNSSLENSSQNSRKVDTSVSSSVGSNKKMRISSQEEELSQTNVGYTRILGDEKMQVKSSTVSRYFGASKVDVTKAKCAGNWFESISSSASTADQFIYDTDLLKNDQHKVSDQQNEDCEESNKNLILTDISNSSAKSNFLKQFEKPASRNPFAIKRPMFDGKQPQQETSTQPAKDEVDDSATSNDEEESPLVIDEGPKTVVESPSPKMSDAHNSSREETSPVISSKPSQPFKSPGAAASSSKTSSILAAFARTPKPKPASEKLTSPQGVMSCSGSGSSSSPFQKAVRPSGLLKSGARGKLHGVKVGKPGSNQPTLTSLFAKQEKRANV